MTTENHLILNRNPRSTEEELERDLRIKVRWLLDQAMHRAVFRKMGRLSLGRERAGAISTLGHFPKRRADNLYEEWTQNDLSFHGQRRIVSKLQGGARDNVKKLNSIYEPAWSLEEAELRQDPKSQQTLQWEQFRELKSRMSSVVNLASREQQLRRLCKLEHQMAQVISYASSSKAIEEIEKQVSTSLKGVRREADRILVEVEGSLLHSKAELYAKLWTTVKDSLTQCQHVTGVQVV